MNERIESLVNECLIKHEGGENFFDAIDEKLRNDNSLINMMLEKIMINEEFDYIIVSGQFGEVFKSFCEKNLDLSFTNKIIVINGGLRHGNNIISFWNNYDINNKKLIFIDDSFYLGRTRNVIKNSIEEHNGNLKRTYVFYDGSKTKDDNVISFYRYYDNYK